MFFSAFVCDDFDLTANPQLFNRSDGSFDICICLMYFWYI